MPEIGATSVPSARALRARSAAAIAAQGLLRLGHWLRRREAEHLPFTRDFVIFDEADQRAGPGGEERP